MGKSTMGNPETLVTLATQDTGKRLEKTQGQIKNGQSRDTGQKLEKTLLPVSLDFPFLICPWIFSTLCPVSCVANLTSVSGLPILDLPLGFL
jgi:hypothetical protein